MRIKRLPTTREIAEACNCNQSTVSLALREHSRISAKTRERILETARKLGWRPNPLASAYMAHLRTTRPPTYQAGLAFLTTHPDSAAISALPMYMIRHYRGALERAASLGYSLEPIWLHERHLSARRLNAILHNRNIVGLIVPGILKPSSILQDIDWKSFSAVALGFSLVEPELHRVAVHAIHGFDLMLIKAIELGYRRIAVVVSTTYDARVSHGVLYPAYYLQKHHPGSQSIETYVFPSQSEDEIPGIQQWLRKHKPEVVLGEEIVWQAIRRMGWRVPQDVAFINNDISPEYPKIGGFDQHHELHGSVAVDVAVSSIIQNERGIPAVPRITLIKGAWGDAPSVPPINEIARLKQPVNQ